jgi:cellulose synthase/poly-beta-1,6-N-acetylglucosamine synthase-like glycosyltransferase
MSQISALIVVALTLGVLAFLVPFASHRTFLLLLARRRRSECRDPWPEEELPRVTVQLPVYNERHVVARLIDAACRIDYPAHLLQIQILDDSDDATSWIAEQRSAYWRGRGVRIEHLTRERRAGFKAGALAEGTARSDGEFMLVLDADFVAPPTLVRDLLPPFRDEAVGMVQARWDHLNADESWLTEAQSFLLDGHFLFEQGGRYAGERFFNFNGTAGIWRRRCLTEAGGWQTDTLTEDLDLSYRAQMAGWRFVYLDDVAVPAEVPATVGALEVQQRRWAQGGIQTARKVLPGLLRSPFPWTVKSEAVVHLLGHLAHPLTWALALLLFPSAVARRALGLDAYLWADLVIFAAATGPFMVFYWTAGRLRGRPVRGLWKGVLRTLTLGVGLSVPVTRAVLRGLTGARDPFIRTPKRGSAERSAYAGGGSGTDSVAKRGMAGLMAAYLIAAVAGGYWGQLPFILLFLAGYAGLGFPGVFSLGARSGSTLGERWSGRYAFAPEPGGVHREEGEEGKPERPSKQDGLRPLTGLLVGAQAEVAEEGQPGHQDPWAAGP